MAQSPNRPSSGAKASGGGGRRRTPPPPVKKPFPWGVVAVSSVLGLLLVGILVYAITNQGSGFQTALSIADKKVDGLKKFDDLKRDHTDKAVQYEQTPPVGGPHNNVPQTCQVYTEPIPSENAVHSLEHGAVWITYKPDLAAGDIAKLASLTQENQYRMLSPFPGQEAKISLQAWGRQVTANSPSDKQVEQFLEAYSSGPQAPERGAACSGNTSTGSLQAPPAVPPVTATVPPASPAQSAPAAPAASPSS